MSTNPGPGNAVLSLQHVSKRFGAVQALQGVSVECRAGEIHAVVGENGSGKSTLLGIASGYLAPDEGIVEIGGERLNAAHAADAWRLGLRMVYQTYSHLLELSVAENLFLAVPPPQRPSFRSMEEWAADRLNTFDANLSPGAAVGTLSLGERQMLEVVKALLSKPRVLLLDEPTTALGPGEIEHLHRLVLARAAEGVGIVYVSHRLPEVLEISDRVTVLRDGQGQGTYDAAEISENGLVALMIGRPLQLAFPERSDDGRSEALLDVAGLHGPRFGPVDLTLLKGEIVGLAGAEGNGQLELLRCLGGVDRATGAVSCLGEKVDLKAPYAALKAGIVLLSGDRIRESLFPVLSVRSNVTIQVLRRFATAGWVRRGSERHAVTELTGRLKVRTPSVEQPVRFLSGGNQQKVALSRTFLRGQVRVILADEPTQGVDVASRFDIYQALRDKAADGVSMIVKSSDPLELAGLCDRVLVISRGRVTDEIPHEELSEERIIEAIVGSGRARRSGGRRVSSAVQPVSAPVTAPVSAPVPAPVPARRVPSWVPLLLMALLMVGVGAYTQSRSSAFLSEYNLNSLLLSALPLACVAIAQANALLVGGFDVSVGAVMALVVMVGSFILTSSRSTPVALIATVALLGIGVGAGLANATLIRAFRLPSIIATLATLSVMQGITLTLRDAPGGEINAHHALRRRSHSSTRSPMCARRWEPTSPWLPTEWGSTGASDHSSSGPASGMGARASPRMSLPSSSWPATPVTTFSS